MLKTTYKIVLTFLLCTLAIPANAQDSKKFATLGDHLPKKGQPTAVQLKFGGDKKVTEDNFVVAESDKYFFEQQDKLFINAFVHDPELVTPDLQTVVRMNRDTMYSKGVFDTKGGVYFELPILETYQSLQVIDEDHKTIAVLYAEKGKNKATITPDMLSFGHHVYCLIRTQVDSMAEEDIQKGREKMRLVIARATESTPYTAKGYDQLLPRLALIVRDCPSLVVRAMCWLRSLAQDNTGSRTTARVWC